MIDDDHDLSYNMYHSTLYCIYLARLAIIWKHSNWMKRSVVFASGRLIQINMIGRWMGHDLMRRAALINDAVRSDTMITNTFDSKIEL